jgi:hypothetical protein
MRPIRACALISLLAAGGCDSPTAPVRTALQERDLVGPWTMAFRVGSPTSPLALGTLSISSDHDPLRPEYLVAEFSADFRPLLGRQVSCLQTPQPALVLLQDSVSVLLALTPDAADCGLEASGQFSANTFTGAWIEPSATSRPQSSGTFSMWRKT